MIYRSVNNSGYIRLAKVESVLTYMDTTALEDGSTYQYKIRAYSDGQTSAASPEVTKVRMNRTRIIHTSNPASGQLQVNWKKNSAARGYQIQYCTDKDFPRDLRITRTVIGSDILSLTIDGLPVKNRYYIRARTYIKTKTGTYFSEWSDVKRQVVR